MMRRKTVKKYLFWLRLIKVFELLPKKLKIQFLLFLGLILLTSILDLLGLALFIPILLLLLQDDYISKHENLAYFYDVLNFSSESNFTIFLLATVFTLIIMKNLASIYLTIKQTVIAMRIQTGISSLTLSSYFASDILKIKGKNSNQIVWEINSLPSQFTRSLLLPLATFFNELIVAIIIGIGLLFYDPRIIFLIGISVIPFTFFFYKITKRKVQEFQKRQNLLTPKLNALVQQSIFGFTDVLLTGTKKLFKSKYDSLLGESKFLTSRLITYMSIPSKIIEIAIIASVSVLIIASIKFGIDRKETLTFLSIFALAAYRLIPSFNKMTVSILSFKSYQFTLNYLNKSLSKITSEHSASSDIKLEYKKLIKVSNLNFSYNNKKEILKEINFTISKGETVGVIGKSGSGKTTLINILLGLLTDYEGKIQIDETELNKIIRSEWYKKIGYVQQNIFLFDGTIKENIAFGIEESKIDIHKVNESIKSANLDELINELPFGIETKVGELGSLISGGQKQRIGIARALYSNAEVLFFDEATSALDKETESQITDTLKSLSLTNKQLTMIVIAHRYSTLKHCNRIIELENGTIKAIKKYEDLL